MNLPNKITIARIFMIPLFVIVFLLPQIPYNYFISAIIFVIACSTDFIDGYIARKYHLVTNLGKFLDPIADKVLVSTALILMLTKGEIFINGLYDWIYVASAVCIAIILARELIVSGFRMVAASQNVVLAADFIGKIKTTFQDIAIAFLLLGVNFFEVTVLTTIFYAIGIVSLLFATVLTIWSGASYIIKNKKVLTASATEDKQIEENTIKEENDD